MTVGDPFFGLGTAAGHSIQACPSSLVCIEPSQTNANQCKPTQTNAKPTQTNTKRRKTGHAQVEPTHTQGQHCEAPTRARRQAAAEANTCLHSATRTLGSKRLLGKRNVSPIPSAQLGWIFIENYFQFELRARNIFKILKFFRTATPRASL